jgi:hypothetical protein
MKRDALDLFDSLEPQPSCLDGIYSSSDVKTPGRRHTASNGHSSPPALSADAQGRRNQSPRLVQRLDLGDRAVTQTELPPEQNHPGIDWRSLERELEDWRRTKISEWKSGCGKRPENAEELANSKRSAAACRGMTRNAAWTGCAIDPI